MRVIRANQGRRGLMLAERGRGELTLAKLFGRPA